MSKHTMSSRRLFVGVSIITVLVVVAGITLWFTIGGRQATSHTTAPTATGGTAPAPAPEALGRKIKARLFYLSEEGTRLASVERDVPYGERPTDQAREILTAQLEPATAPIVSAIPPGTTLRAVFVTADGVAFVDVSRDISTAHPGGTLNELLTIYTIVHALTSNMPAINAVQILVDGKEADTLAGHVDLRRPLSPNVDLTMSN